MAKKEVTIILHNIRSLHNVGSIFRTADAAGVLKIYLTGYTPSPLDIFGKIRKEIAKTALGAEKTISWEKCKDIGKLIFTLPPASPKLKRGEQDVNLIAVEQDKRAVNYKKFPLDSPRRSSGQVTQGKKPIVFIFGNEVRGLSKQILNRCDAIIEIPMKGEKESLNVSVAAGIILFHFN